MNNEEVVTQGEPQEGAVFVPQIMRNINIHPRAHSQVETPLSLRSHIPRLSSSTCPALRLGQVLEERRS